LPARKKTTGKVLAHASSSSVVEVAKQHKGGLVVTTIVVLAARGRRRVRRSTIFLRAPVAPAAQAKITQVSHWNKPMNTARLSPDGRTVAFTSPVAGIPQVFVMLSSGGEPLQLTRDEGQKVVDSFSFDGSEIYFNRVLGRDEVRAIPTLGGSPAPPGFWRSLVPSADGSSLFYLKIKQPRYLPLGEWRPQRELVYSFDIPSGFPVLNSALS